MNHRQILDLALREMPAPKAAYLNKVADALSRDASMEERSHLAYPVLAAAAAGIEPMLEPADCARHVIDFLNRHAEGVAHTLYSADYLSEPARAMTPWADRLKAGLATAIMDRLASGQLEIAERKVWRVRADGNGLSGDFPYGDGDD